MEYVLGLGTSCRPYCILVSTVSRWSAAGSPLEVVLLAKLVPDISGNDFADARSRAGLLSWRHLQPTRSRGSAKCRGAGSDALVRSHIRLSSFPVCTAAACQRSRASAAEVVHLLFYASD